jgi:hypothetical protein
MRSVLQERYVRSPDGRCSGAVGPTGMSISTRCEPADAFFDSTEATS